MHFHQMRNILLHSMIPMSAQKALVLAKDEWCMQIILASLI